MSNESDEEAEFILDDAAQNNASNKRARSCRDISPLR